LSSFIGHGFEHTCIMCKFPIPHTKLHWSPPQKQDLARTHHQKK
jgi:hypothetical protein